MKKIISGKVREVYQIDDSKIVIVTTDRISAFDVILPTPVPKKGLYLNKISNYWFRFTSDIVPNHILSESLEDMPEFFQADASYFDQRTVLAKKLDMLPFEFVVRGYIFGNMWNAYQAGTEFCGQKITGSYQLAEKLKTPIITPSIKRSEGHDEYISMEELYDSLGNEKAEKICSICLALYNRCCEHALKQGIIIADTKFEFGLNQDGQIVLGDEIFTPDSSRFWDAASYVVGQSPKSYDKQYVRDWLIGNSLNGVEPAPELPVEVVERTSQLYAECYQKITGESQK